MYVYIYIHENQPTPEEIWSYSHREYDDNCEKVSGYPNFSQIQIIRSMNLTYSFMNTLS